MSEGKLIIELVSPLRLLLKDEVSEVVAPGSEGEFGILPGHRPFLTLLKCGEVHYKQASGVRRVAISGGFAEVSEDHVRIMADTAELSDEIDLERAEKAKSVAEEKLKELDRVKDEAEFAKFQAKLDRALCRIKVKSGD